MVDGGSLEALRQLGAEELVDILEGNGCRGTVADHRQVLLQVVAVVPPCAILDIATANPIDEWVIVLTPNSSKDTMRYFLIGKTGRLVRGEFKDDPDLVHTRPEKFVIQRPDRVNGNLPQAQSICNSVGWDWARFSGAGC